MSLNRILAMMYRYMVSAKHSYDNIADLFYWPALELIIWGMTGIYLAKLANNEQGIFSIVTGLVFWIIVWRAQYEMGLNLLVEIWEKNLVNVFAAPITIKEYITSLTIYGFFKMLLSLSFSAGVAFFLYQYNIFQFGWYLLPVIASLLITGWTIGFIVMGLLIRFSAKIQTVAWTGAALISPFSAPYFPLTLLPDWAQAIARFIPTSYMFEGLREIAATGNISYDKIVLSLALNILYLILSIKFFFTMFRKSRTLGLGRLI